MANTILNTDPFKQAFIELDNAKRSKPDFTTASLMAYVSLSATLEICINWKMGVREIQALLDEKTLKFLQELHELNIEKKIAEMENA